MGEDKVITITQEEYDDLRDDQLKLNCLEDYGVDNGEGYDDAMREYRETKE